MLKNIIITLATSLVASLCLSLFTQALAAPKSPSPQQECFRYSYLKTSMSQSIAEKSCEKINNPFALACSKMAIAYLYRENQERLLDSCSKIKTEKSLSCVIKQAIQAQSNHAKEIARCS